MAARPTSAARIVTAPRVNAPAREREDNVDMKTPCGAEGSRHGAAIPR
ncbi:hypothetical protein [Methylocystis sp. SB2]|nr:hypothetical protein [Methylocystis sp. SB2]ULO24533.1 hypothetical protein LNB28_03765 [Methylocystis sp. SB2]